MQVFLSRVKYIGWDKNLSFIDVKIKIPEKGWPVDVNGVMHRKRARGGFCGFPEKGLVS